MRLHLAAYTGNEELVKELLDQGENVNELDENHHSPLIMAAYGNHANVINLLLKAKADPNLSDSENFTPLHIAAGSGNFEIVSALLAAKADPNLITLTNSSPLDLVNREENPEIAELLEQVTTATKSVPHLDRGQNWLINKMLFLGYESNEKGICFGVTHMALQAILLDDFATFLQRLTIINSLPSEKDAFIKAIDEIKQKRLSLIQEVKNKHNLQQLRNLTPEEASLIKSDIIAIENKLQRLAVENLPTDEIARRRREMQFFAFTQRMIVERLSSLRKEEQLILDIPAFFDGIELYFQPKKYKILFPETLEVLQQDALLSSILTASIKLDDNKQSSNLKSIDQFSAYYSVEDLEKYFQTFAAAVEAENASRPVALMLDGNQHSILAGYDPAKKAFIFFNPNTMDYEPCISSARKMANLVLEKLNFDQLTLSPSTLIFTDIYSDTMQAARLEKIKISWRSNPEWKEIHNLASRIIFVPQELLGMWLANSFFKNDVTTVAEISKFTPGIKFLLFAIGDKNIPMVRALLEAKTNPNSEFKDIKPLLFAFENGNREIIKLLLTAGADPNISRVDTKLTPLHSAVLAKDLDLVEFLLKNNATPSLSIKSTAGYTPLEYAQQMGLTAIVDCINNHLQKNAVTKAEFMQAWRSVFPNECSNLNRKLNASSVTNKLLNEIQNAKNDSEVTSISKSFIDAYKTHPLAKELTRIIETKLPPSLSRGQVHT
jgi:ankyrin repeat protein